MEPCSTGAQPAHNPAADPIILRMASAASRGRGSRMSVPMARTAGAACASGVRAGESALGASAPAAARCMRCAATVVAPVGVVRARAARVLTAMVGGAPVGGAAGVAGMRVRPAGLVPQGVPLLMIWPAPRPLLPRRGLLGAAPVCLAVFVPPLGPC